MGETKPTLRERFKEHIQATNNPLTPRKRHSSSPFPLLSTWPLDRRHKSYSAGIKTRPQHLTP